MKVLGIAKVTREQGVVTERRYIVEVTEDEADKITGVAGKPHAPNRYKPGMTINISKIYDKVKRINERHAEIVAAAIELKLDAEDIKNAIPLTED